MDNIKFNDMKVGGQYNTVALLQAVTEKVAKNGKPFVELELSDGAVVIIARQFDCCESELIINGIRPEVIVYATIKVDVYRGIKNYTVIVPVFAFIQVRQNLHLIIYYVLYSNLFRNGHNMPIRGAKVQRIIDISILKNSVLLAKRPFQTEKA